MSVNAHYVIWNLKEIINFIVSKNENISEIYLFGSRAYGTGSLRSDIDLLVVSSVCIPDLPIRDDVHKSYPPVDLFFTTDNRSAKSIMNGSVLNIRDGFCKIIEQIDAILLWDKGNGFSNDFESWNQTTSKDVDFKMSVIPSYPIIDISTTIKQAMQNLSVSGIESFFSGTDFLEMANTIIKMIETSFEKPSNYARKAKSFSFDKIEIHNEYDFQNFIHLILRPVFNSIQTEPIEVIIDGNAKKADFSISRNRIVIEAKYIDSTSKKAEVLKTLDGLANFYQENANIRALIFLILFEEGLDLDSVFLNDKYTKEYNAIPIFTKFIKNTYPKS